MLEALKFVQGAIGRSGALVTELTHFRIADRRITSYNGRISLSSPISLDIKCSPKAESMVKAILACEDTVELHLTANKRLSIKSGNFRSLVETIDDAFVGLEPEGQRVVPTGPLQPVFALLSRAVSQDASRPWSTGILFDGPYAYATNNVVLVQHWLGYHFPFRVNVPMIAVKELLRIGEEPTEIWVTANSATFFFKDYRWLKTQLGPTDWPNIGQLLDGMAPTSTQLPESFWSALERIKPFVGDLGTVYIRDKYISTSRDPDIEGTTIDVPELSGFSGAFRIEMLMLLEGLADVVGLEEYPRPCPFYGQTLRGLIAGMRE